MRSAARNLTSRQVQRRARLESEFAKEDGYTEGIKAAIEGMNVDLATVLWEIHRSLTDRDWETCSSLNLS